MRDPDPGARPLGHVDVVLVRPRQPGNVGAVARAIANHGLGRLVLVAPPAFDPERARWMAPGAHGVLDDARIVNTLAEAVVEHQHVIGSSGRPRRWRRPVVSPWQLGSAVSADSRPTALVFGQEDFGMSNEDLSLCSALLTLPTAGHDSLNLAQAVTVTASWLLGAWCQTRDADKVPAPARPGVPMGLRQGLVNDLLEVLRASGYLDNRPDAMVRSTLHQLATKLDSLEEARVLRGMLKPVRWKLGVLPKRG